MGELHGRRGLVPSNFLTDVPPSAYFRVTDPAPAKSPLNGGFHSNGAPVHADRARAVVGGGGVGGSVAVGGGSAVRNNQPRILGQQKRW
jgi:hypothetical protein